MKENHIAEGLWLRDERKISAETDDLKMRGETGQRKLQKTTQMTLA